MRDKRIKQEIEEGKVHLYKQLADSEARLNKANRYYFYGGLIVCLFFVVMSFLDPGVFAKNSKIFIYIQIGLVAVFTVFGFYRNYKDQSKAFQTREVLIILMALVFFFANLSSANVGVLFAVYTVAISAMMYDDTKMIDRCMVCILAVSVWKLCYLWVKESPDTMAGRMTYIGQFLLVFMLVFAMMQIARLNHLFNEASRIAIMEKQKEQEHILEEVLNIVEVVQKGSMDVSEIIANLRESSETVSTSIEEISYGNQNTCESVEQQTQMTQAISENISVAAERTNEMADAFEIVEKEVKHGMELMDVLNKQSDLIADKSAMAVEAMEKLSKRTLDMRSFAEEIFGISSQTNLLALNASIEAARAGEAGKGFAVVADEIRELSEQTRQTTEKITALIEELNTEAENVSNAVGMAKEAVSTQNQAISETGSAFSNVGDKVSNLTGLVQDIRQSASSLIDSNNAIVDSISQLSAVTEEVTASSDAVSEIAEDNKESAVNANSLLDEVIKTSHKLDQFIQKN